MDFIKMLSEELDSQKVFKFSEVDSFKEIKNWISTGSPWLDYKLRTHGWPTGIIEVRGQSQSGKTTFSLEALKNCILSYAEKSVAVILSSERRDNKELAKAIGLPVDQVLIVRVKTVEDTFNQLSRVVNKVIEKNGGTSEGIRFLFVWDSVGQTVSSQEKDALNTRAAAKLKGDDVKSAAMGSAARANSLGLRGVMSFLDEVDMTFFMINRAYDNIGTPGKTSYGGKAMEFYPTMRIELSKKEAIKIGEEEVGQITKVKTIKTDFDRPKQTFEIEIGYGYGIVLSQWDIKLGVDNGILEKFGVNGAKFNDKLKWKTRRELYQHYEDKNPMLKVLLKKLYKKAHELVTAERAEKE